METTVPQASTAAPADPPTDVRRSAFAVLVWLAVLLCCLAGDWVTWELSVEHGHLEGGGKGLLADIGCSAEPGQPYNCDQVLQSPYATLKIPQRVPFDEAVKPNAPKVTTIEVPYAWIGLVYFTALTVWFLFIGLPTASRWPVYLIPLAILVPGVIGSALFLRILFFKMPAICPLCVATHVLNAFVLLGTVLLCVAILRRRHARSADVTPSPSGRQLVTTLVLMAAIAVIAFRTQSFAKTANRAAYYEKKAQDYESNPLVMWEIAKDQIRNAKQYEIPIDPDDPIKGPPTAKRTLTVFTDLQCPACRRLDERLTDPKFWAQLEMFTAAQGGIRMVFKHFPLSTGCNPYAQVNAHAYSCDAALAVEAARIVGGDAAYWKMINRLFAEQNKLYEAPYDSIAKEIGLDVDAFRAARASREAAARIARDVEQGHNVGMSATPGLYLDGVPITPIAGSGPSVWRRILSLPQWPPTPEELR